MMSAIASSFSSSLAFTPRPGQAGTLRASPSLRSFASTAFRGAGARVRASRSKTSSSFRRVLVVRCLASTTGDVPSPTVSETKSNFLRAYSKPIPSVYNTVLQELIVQQHFMRYKKRYQYDPIFALGFVTVYDQLMEGYPSDDDRDAIFRAYVQALEENPDQYRTDAKKLEEWARVQNASSLCDFPSSEGDVEGVLKSLAERAGAGGSFSYSRFFAIGLFRLIELANATVPATLEKLCAALNINKRSVDRDLDIYRNLLTKLVQAKELLKEYVEREKKKREERVENQKADGAMTKCLGEFQYTSL